MTKPVYGSSAYQPLSSIPEVIDHLDHLNRNQHQMLKNAKQDALLKAVGADPSVNVSGNPSTFFGATATKAAHANRHETGTLTPDNNNPKGHTRKS